MEKSDDYRFKGLFDQLDTDGDGVIDVQELANAFQLKHLLNARKHAANIISEIDQDSNTTLDYREFETYMIRQEERLRQAFDAVDKNKDGTIEPAEVKAALETLGVIIDLHEAEELTLQLDTDSDQQISWSEWKDYFSLVPMTSLADLFVYWRQTLMIDIGEQMTVPPDFTKKEQQSGAWWRHLVAGGVAGAVSRLMTAPLDRLKILLQVGVGDGRKFTIFGGMKHMVKEGGVRSLWRGNLANMLKIAPESACKFAAYEQMKKVVTSYTGNTGQITPVERFIAGSSAGAIAQTTIYPMEVLKTRLAVAKTGDHKGIVDCTLNIYKGAGLRGFYKGYVPNIMGILPYAGIDLSLYETLKVFYKKQQGEDKPPGVLVLLACGTTSSTCGQLATYPLALIRTRLQAQGPKSGATMKTVIKSIMKEHGPRGFYRGIIPNFLKVLPAVSISYVMYEQMKTVLGV